MSSLLPVLLRIYRSAASQDEPEPPPRDQRRVAPGPRPSRRPPHAPEEVTRAHAQESPQTETGRAGP